MCLCQHLSVCMHVTCIGTWPICAQCGRVWICVDICSCVRVSACLGLCFCVSPPGPCGFVSLCFTPWASFVADGLIVMERWPWTTGGSQQDSRDSQGQRPKVRAAGFPRVSTAHMRTPGWWSQSAHLPLPNWTGWGRTTQASISPKPFNNGLLREMLGGSRCRKRERQRQTDRQRHREG